MSYRKECPAKTITKNPDIMNAVIFKYSLLLLCTKPRGSKFIDDEIIARHLAAEYIDTDNIIKKDLTLMLRRDLKELNLKGYEHNNHSRLV